MERVETNKILRHLVARVNKLVEVMQEVLGGEYTDSGISDSNPDLEGELEEGELKDLLENHWRRLREQRESMSGSESESGSEEKSGEESGEESE